MDCTGKRIAFTGISPQYDRQAIHGAISQAGGTLVTSVNARTDLLVIGENPGNGQSKRDGAKKHGVPTISAGEFMGQLKSASAGWPWPTRATPSPKKATPARRAKEVSVAIESLKREAKLTGFVGF